MKQEFIFEKFSYVEKILHEEDTELKEKLDKESHYQKVDEIDDNYVISL